MKKQALAALTQWLGEHQGPVAAVVVGIVRLDDAGHAEILRADVHDVLAMAGRAFHPAVQHRCNAALAGSDVLTHKTPNVALIADPTANGFAVGSGVAEEIVVDHVLRLHQSGAEQGAVPLQRSDRRGWPPVAANACRAQRIDLLQQQALEIRK